MRKFNKLAFLVSNGLMQRRYNYETKQFEFSGYLLVYSYITLLVQITFPLKLFVSLFWDRHHIYQLYIGNIYNYLADEPRFFMGPVGLIVSSWALCIHVLFNRIHVKNDYHLIRRWMKITFELPIKSEKEYRIAGLSRKETKQFFEEEDSFLANYHRIINIALFASYGIFPAQLFFVTGYDADLLTYIGVQTVHVLHTSYFLWLYLGGVYTVNAYYCIIILFFTKRFQWLSKQLETLNAANTKPVDNRKLSRLIIEYNLVQFELMEMNELFKGYCGINYIHLFGFALGINFCVLEADVRLKIALFIVNLVMYGSVVLVPSSFATQLLIQINKTKHQFENISFRKSVNLIIKQKIESISSLSEHAGFTCFDWFQITTHTGFNFSLELMVYLLLLLATTYYVKGGGFLNLKYPIGTTQT